MQFCSSSLHTNAENVYGGLISSMNHNSAFLSSLKWILKKRCLQGALSFLFVVVDLCSWVSMAVIVIVQAIDFLGSVYV